METQHKLFFANSANMTRAVKDKSVDLVVTSPAYPMIKMWDNLYEGFNPKIKKALKDQNGGLAFEMMHKELDKTWAECARVLKQGGMAVINVGDAVRSLNTVFRLYSNHSRIVQAFEKLGFNPLPLILWRKPANSPNKFIGSGVLPAGAYITLEHEYILVFRKGGKRLFQTEDEKQLRGRSSFFWEERNKWFSDLWLDVKGAPQNTNDSALRTRSAAFPFELAFRLICMFSVQGDTVLDPFSGTGVTMMAAIGTGRNSIGFEIDQNFRDPVAKKINNSIATLNNHTLKRLSNHVQWANQHIAKKAGMKYKNTFYGFPVMTKKETEICLPFVKSAQVINQAKGRNNRKTASKRQNLSLCALAQHALIQPAGFKTVSINSRKTQKTGMKPQTKAV